MEWRENCIDWQQLPHCFNGHFIEILHDKTQRSDIPYKLRLDKAVLFQIQTISKASGLQLGHKNINTNSCVVQL